MGVAEHAFVAIINPVADDGPNLLGLMSAVSTQYVPSIYPVSTLTLSSTSLLHGRFVLHWN